jgi:hypothetical protein
MQPFPLRVWSGPWAVCRLSPEAPVPSWAGAGARLIAVVRTEGELSILAPADRVPDDVVAERDFRVIEVVGPVPFAVVGLMAAMTRALAEADVSVLTVGTYDTDYVLVRDGALDAAVTALRAAGFTIQ